MRFFVLGLIPVALVGQSGATWNDLRAKNPSGIEFHLRLMEARECRQGELIRIELNLPSFSPGQLPPAEQWQPAGFLLDPPADCGTVAKPCQPRAPQFG